MAEGEGFEPPEPFGSTVFKTAAFNHSANPPDSYFFLARAGLTGVAFTRSTICAVTSGFALR